MMFHAQSSSRNHCSLLAVLSRKFVDDKQKQAATDDKPKYPFPEIASSGRLEVHLLSSPSTDEFRRLLESSEPNIVYLQGEKINDSEEIGSLVWGDVDLSTPEALCGLFGSTLPTTVYLEIPNGENFAEALHSRVRIIMGNITCSSPFLSRLLSGEMAVKLGMPSCSTLKVVISCSHTWDAFQLAHASFRLYCVRNNIVMASNSQKGSSKLGPHLLGDPPKIDIALSEMDVQGEENSPENLPAIKIYDDDVTMRFLVCGVPCTLDTSLLGPLEDGLNALLNIEIRGSKLHNRTSAPPPPLQAGAFSRGVVTMRCDLSTCSSAHISLLVSGSAQTCFNDQLLENHIKNELIENSQLVHALPNSGDNRLPPSEPRKSASIACGASVFEVSMKVSTWASQVLRQLAPDVSYRSLVMLGIASIQGLSVASFEKDDAERLLFFCTRQGKADHTENSVLTRPPSWLTSPAPSRKRSEPCRESKGVESENVCNVRPKLNAAAMRPIPHTRHHKMLPFSGFSEIERYDGDQVKANLPVAPLKHSSAGPTPVTHRKSLSSSYQAQQIISLNPLPLKKHGCGRAPIQVCSEEEFLRDVMQFLILRGHTRLVPQGGLAEFPDAILNAKRLDLFNLYREGVGNTLKRHYETYLLEYELAHDDVDGECCLLCHSSAAGDWVNCGICGEWAHFGCDRRQGLGAFKDYAKTDGLEYVCPQCSVTNFKKKSQKTSNGY
ncbi:at-rich interactive domain-containing protein 4 [Citrus sinensis]|uniref:At-rich interactive domain-containing protein 4 n=2 Tax=Citrus sinensis TaxID=2711 RepID=A0ACB8P2Z4_CITSI|nr:at-rich interactive domain-containing protein 4 [Citrus sinensis]